MRRDLISFRDNNLSKGNTSLLFTLPFHTWDSQC